MLQFGRFIRKKVCQLSESDRYCRPADLDIDTVGSSVMPVPITSSGDSHSNDGYGVVRHTFRNAFEPKSDQIVI